MNDWREDENENEDVVGWKKTHPLKKDEREWTISVWVTSVILGWEDGKK